MAKQKKFEEIVNTILEGMFLPMAEAYTPVSEAVASKRQELPSENFDGWLPITINNKSFYDFTTAELKNIRDVSRNLSITSEIYKNVMMHYRNNIVGAGLSISIYPEDLGEDPVALAGQTDTTIAKMKENWKLFSKKNKMHKRTVDWLMRKKRDGEAFLRLFPSKDAPIVRFIDPHYISSDSTDAPYGITFDVKDSETVKSYHVKDQNNIESTVKPEDILHSKDTVDMDAPRGFPQGYCIFTNVRRADKLMVNVAILAQIQSAIAMVRKHKNLNQAKLDSYLSKTSTGTKTNTSGATVRTRQMDAGTILDTNDATDYEFPAHTVNASGLLSIGDRDLALIAAAFVLPVKWLLSAENPEPLPPSSPVVSNFRTEQELFYEDYVELFWRVQEMMGIDRETNEIKYNVSVEGPRLAIAKALDQARVDEILQRIGASSPQESAASNGNNWLISRANTIKHRKTAMPDEQMPGDSGNTNTGGGDGLSKTKGGQRGADGSGGNQDV